jgi:hypothetical protein
MLWSVSKRRYSHVVAKLRATSRVKSGRSSSHVHSFSVNIEKMEDVIHCSRVGVFVSYLTEPSLQPWLRGQGSGQWNAGCSNKWTHYCEPSIPAFSAKDAKSTGAEFDVSNRDHPYHLSVHPRREVFSTTPLGDQFPLTISSSDLFRLRRVRCDGAALEKGPITATHAPLFR